MLKERLVWNTVIIALNWEKKFELMRDASNYSIGVVFG